MLGSSSLFGGASPKRKREDGDILNPTTQQEQQQQQVIDSVSAGLDEESLQIVEYFEKREADQQKMIDELTREMEELNLEKSMETFMSKLMGKLVLDDSKNDSPSTAASAVMDDKRLKQIKRMQLDENVVLKVGGRLFYSTKRTLCGEGHVEDLGGEEQEPEYEKNSNLFKVMFFSNFQITYVTAENGVQAINFEDRNPDNFEYILEHLRANGRVKCLGLEELSYDKLTSIHEEAQFFLTQKLINYIEKLLLKKAGDSMPRSLDQIIKQQPLQVATQDAPIPIKSSLPTEWLEQFKKIDLSNKERMFELIDTTKAQINLTKQQVIDFSNSLRDKLVEFMGGNNESDMSIKLDVSGTCFNIPFKVFKVHKEFILFDFILSENFALTSKGTIFIDRNPELFQIIYSYLISGNFNNFPVLTPSNKKRLKHEAQFYRLSKLIKEYFDDCRYPIETIGTENIKIKEQEDYLRELFVKDRSNPMLDDKYLLLAPIFAMRHQIDGTAKDKYQIPNCPKLLNFSDAASYSRFVTEPVMVKSLEVFQSSWLYATAGLLSGLDWNNVFAAGGIVLGCLLDGKNAQSYRKYNRYMSNAKTPILREKQDSDDEEEGFEEPNVTEPVIQTRKGSQNEIPSSTEYLKLDYTYQYSDYNFANLKNRAQNQTTQQAPSHTSLYGTQSIFGASSPALTLSYNPTPSLMSSMPTIGMPTMPTMGLSTLSGPFTMPIITPSTKPMATPATSLFVPGMTMSTLGYPALSSTGIIGGSSIGLANQQVPLSMPPSEFHNSDIDLFLYALTPEQAEDKLRHIYQVVKNNNAGSSVLVVRTQFTVTFYAQKVIQVILRLYKSPAEILLGFDICAACVGYDGSQVWSNARARRALAQKTNLVDPDRMSTSYEARLYKYARRGFSVSVPGYDPGKIKNHFLMFPRTYRSRYIDVQGLARILLMDYANKSPKTTFLLSEFERNKALQKQIAKNRLLKYFDKDFKSDYDDIPIYQGTVGADVLFNSFSKRVELFQTISKIPNWKPYYIFALNNIEAIINDTSNSSNLSEKIQWIEVNPGSQKIGSFKPVMTNFYRDAYNYATSATPNVTRKKRIGKQTYTATWGWEKNISAHTFESYSMLISNKIELAYRKYCDNMYNPSNTCTTVPIMDNYHVDFTTMQQINTSDPTRRRKVQRQIHLAYSSTFEDVPVKEISSKTYY